MLTQIAKSGVNFKFFYNLRWRTHANLKVKYHISSTFQAISTQFFRLLQSAICNRSRYCNKTLHDNADCHVTKNLNFDFF